VAGNIIGLAADGDTPLPNTSRGVGIVDAHDNILGGNSAAAQNVVSGNSDHGILISGAATGNVIQGNYIGLNAAGTTARGNGNDGIFIFGVANTTIGGTAAGTGNVISGNAAFGVNISDTTAAGNLVQGNYIGTDKTGTLAVPNASAGVLINLGAHNNTVGGTAPGSRNLISGNGNSGVWINPNTGVPSHDNFVQGNYIGTDVSGTVALGNFDHGVVILGSTTNTIGGTTAAARNVISGNGFNGVDISAIGPEVSIGNIVQGNYIGVDVNGTAALPNAGSGVGIDGINNIIGGGASGAGNVISGNTQDGILLFGVTDNSNTGNQIKGNFIGTDYTGTAALGNHLSGIASGAPANFLGGPGPGEGNVISANVGNGIVFFGTGNNASGNFVQGNFIGTDVTGTLNLGNHAQGILIADAQNNRIGGTAAGAANIIANNAHGPLGGTACGIGVSGATSTGNQIQENSIFANSGLGIDLAENGITANDAGDADTGPNNLQNFPVISSATYDLTSLVVHYSVDSTSGNSAYPLTIDFYLADSNGQGKHT
jgi:titin